SWVSKQNRDVRDRKYRECFRPPHQRRPHKTLSVGNHRAQGIYARIPKCVQRGHRVPARPQRRAWTGTLALERKEQGRATPSLRKVPGGQKPRVWSWAGKSRETR